MPREAKNAGFLPQGMWFWKRYVFCLGKRSAAAGIKPQLFAHVTAAQETQAVQVLVDRGSTGGDAGVSTGTTTASPLTMSMRWFTSASYASSVSSTEPMQ